MAERRVDELPVERHWKWQEIREVLWVPGLFKNNAMYMASSDVTTSFDMARSGLVAEIQEWTRCADIAWQRWWR